MEDDEIPVKSEARCRPCWKYVNDLKVGMVLAKPVDGSSCGYVTMQISAGGTISEEMIVQMLTKGIECVAVVNKDPLPEKDYALAVQQYENRLREIFGPQPDEHCLNLLTALLARGPVLC